jgi:hypothetical protein
MSEVTGSDWSDYYIEDWPERLQRHTMKMEQWMELMLARLDSFQKHIKTNQAKIDANTIVWRDNYINTPSMKMQANYYQTKSNWL